MNRTQPVSSVADYDRLTKAPLALKNVAARSEHPRPRKGLRPRPDSGPRFLSTSLFCLSAGAGKRKGIVMTDRTERGATAFRLNLEQQKNRAKDLLRAVKAGDSEALSRLAAARRSSITSDSPDGPHATAKLADAQFVIARELRFASWAKLKAHIESMDRQRAAIDEKRPAPDADLKTLHIRCGHDIQEKLVKGGFVGDFLPYITPYCVGPVRQGPEGQELMARFIVEAFFEEEGSDVVAGQLEGLLHRQHLLDRSAEDYERVVIWKEQDNWCQTVLARLLAHYANAKRPRVLELIALDDFPGGERFMGLGNLPEEALRLLWSSRKPVTSAQLALGHDAWNALSSDDPRHLAAVARSGTPALPIMAPALHRHLRELPSVENGLRLTEQLILQIVSEGTADGLRLWADVWHRLVERDPHPWITDTWFLQVIKDMLAGSGPLLTFTRIPPHPDQTTVLLPSQLAGPCRQLLAITELGRTVLHGERDWHSLRHFSRWVGGVHILPGVAGWRWDEAKRDAVLREA